MPAVTARNTCPVPQDQRNQVLNVPYEEYAAADAINAHGLMDILTSPAHFQYRLRAHGEPSDDLLLGTLLDMALTEPDRFADTVRYGDRRRVKAEKGQVVITESMHARIQHMLAGIGRNAIAQDLLASRVANQPTVYWRDAVHGVDCKARLDLVCQFGGKRVAVDIKTAKDASAAEFAKAAARYHYDLQMAHYLEAGRVTGLWHPHLFFFIVVNKTAPFDCFVYQGGDTMLSRGVANRDHAMQLYAQCHQAGDWPGPPQFQRLELPAWARPVEEPEAPVMAEDDLPDI